MVNESRNPTVGTLLREWIDCPSISEDEVRSLAILKSGKITRHIDIKYLDAAKRGYFRFGTLIGYRPKDEMLIGRFSDVQEASQLNYYRSRTGVYNYYGASSSYIDCVFSGYDYGMAIEFFCNDYCSCSSRSDFNMQRALTLRSKGNPDIGAYIVYDVKKLIDALNEILNEEHPHLSLIHMPVTYGQKDRAWDIEGYHKDIVDKDKIAIWLGTAFVKSIDYRHEEEVRILVINKKSPGSLSVKNEYLAFEDKRIADSVIRYGLF